MSAPQRRCPRCDSATQIAADEPLWPLQWRCGQCDWSPAVKNGVATLAPELDGQISGIDPGNFAQIREWEAGHFWFVSRNELIGWLLRRHLRSADRVMEIGCGTGYVISVIKSAIPGARIVGSELHSSGLEFARQRHAGTVEFVQMDARALHVEQIFDGVFAFDVLEHIEDDVAVLRQVHRALKPGGVLMATVPQHPWLWGYSDEAAHHVRRYRRRELPAKAADAGFEVVFVDSFSSLLLPLMAASRLASRRQPAGEDPRKHLQREFELPAGVNSIFLAIQRLEHALRRIGLRMPFGGSQVMVARKATAPNRPAAT